MDVRLEIKRQICEIEKQMFSSPDYGTTTKGIKYMISGRPKMANKTAKQRFQFNREFYLRGQLGRIQGMLLIILESPSPLEIPMSEKETILLRKSLANIEEITKYFGSVTAYFKEAKFGKST